MWNSKRIMCWCTVIMDTYYFPFLSSKQISKPYCCHGSFIRMGPQNKDGYLLTDDIIILNRSWYWRIFFMYILARKWFLYFILYYEFQTAKCTNGTWLFWNILLTPGINRKWLRKTVLYFVVTNDKPSLSIFKSDVRVKTSTI